MTWLRAWLDEVAPVGRPVIPRELLDRTWSYPRTESGAAVSARRDPGGHAITTDTIGELGRWIAELHDESPRTAEKAAQTGSVEPSAPGMTAAPGVSSAVSLW